MKDSLIDYSDFFFPELPFVIMQRGGKITRQESLWVSREDEYKEKNNFILDGI